MRSSWKCKILSLVALVAMGIAHRAQAQTLLANGNTLTYNGLTYTISTCSYTLAGITQSGCGPSTASIEGIGSGRGASIEVLDTNGTSLLSLANGSTAAINEIAFKLTAVASSSTTIISSVTDALNGTGNIAYPTQVSAGVTSPSLTRSLTTSLAQLTDSASFTGFNPTAAAPLYLSVDLKIDNRATGNQGAITLTSSRIQAPEPGSIALFGTALTGLVAIRRRSKRPLRQIGRVS